MHRVDSSDYATVSGKRRFKETPAPATVLGKDFKNAAQEEICLVVENAGITLNASGTADETAGWGQLDAALKRHVAVNVMAYGADATGVADNTAAFNTALAVNGSIIIPPGDYRLDGALTLPTGGGMFGAGYLTTLQFNTTAIKLAVVAKDFIFESFMIEDGGASPTQWGIDIVLTTGNVVIINNVKMSGLYGHIKAIGASEGHLIGNNVTLVNSGVGGNLSLGGTGASGFNLKSVNINNLVSTQSTAGNLNIELLGSLINGGGAVNIGNSYIYGGIFKHEDDTARMWVRNSFIDLDEYRFEDSNGGGFRNCVMGSDNANTVTNDYSASNSRTHWVDVRDDTDKISISGNYEGIFTKRRKTGAAVSIASLALVQVDFNTEDDIKMANNAAYTKDAVYSNPAFTVKGYGSGRVKIWVEVHITIDTPGTYPPATNWQNITLYISSTGDFPNIYLPCINPGVISGSDTCMFGGHYEIQAEATDSFQVNVLNSITGGSDGIKIDEASIIVEGL